MIRAELPEDIQDPLSVAYEDVALAAKGMHDVANTVIYNGGDITETLQPAIQTYRAALSSFVEEYLDDETDSEKVIDTFCMFTQIYGQSVREFGNKHGINIKNKTLDASPYENMGLRRYYHDVYRAHDYDAAKAIADHFSYLYAQTMQEAIPKIQNNNTPPAHRLTALGSFLLGTAVGIASGAAYKYRKHR